jgi:hypothetical protein
MTSTPEEPDSTELEEQDDLPGPPGPPDDPSEPGDVAWPGSPEFDDDNEPLTGADADPEPGATAG